MRFLGQKKLRDHVFDSNLPWDVTGAAAAGIGGAVAAAKCFADQQHLFGGLAAAGAVVGTLATTGRGYSAFQKSRRDDAPHELDGVLFALHAILTEGVGKPCVSPDLRICVFVPHASKPHTVIQRTDYVGPVLRHGRGRELSSRCGIVGRAIRNGVAYFDSVPAKQTVAKYLADNYGFDREEARGMRDDRKAYAAVPVGDPGKVVAAIYLDTQERDFFGKRGSPRRQVLESVTLGVARFVAPA